jgi:lipopolysaccharide/colanic/teichoic acid biosynthesis glycosyltransferase
MFKRFFDFISAFIGLIVLSPLFLVVAVAIRITMPGPVFFRQVRVGKDGRLYTLLKFRTMTGPNSDNPVTLEGDARITPIGKILRRYKLDELPQLWHVLTGDMSLVGPRPDVPGYADLLTGDDRRILTMRPGITGPATLKYANEEEILARQTDPRKYNDEVIFPDKVRINLEYLARRNFLLDLRIILNTIIGKKLKEPWAQ